MTLTALSWTRSLCVPPARVAARRCRQRSATAGCFVARAYAPPRHRAAYWRPPQDVDESDVSSSEEDDGAGASGGPGHYRRQGSIFGDMLRTLSERFGEDPLDYDSDDEPRVPMSQRAVVGATLRACPSVDGSAAKALKRRR